ncbi:MAG: hypothetical protein HC889_02280 [Synechococcaceae cyanobacterium SM1_2_3]|nr:hypothetical protein [Synechococcaceae cyanobacterium SM1_2_3]
MNLIMLMRFLRNHRHLRKTRGLKLPAKSATSVEKRYYRASKVLITVGPSVDGRLFAGIKVQSS